jgi:secreted Zn-dependent insulinase-like peptidase
MQDVTWKVPKVNVMITLEAIQPFSTPIGLVLTEIFASCLKEALSEYSYYADCAGEYELAYHLILLIMFIFTSCIWTSS